MNVEIGTERTARVVEFFGRHLVALGLTVRTTDDVQRGLPPHFVHYSGTLIRVLHTVYFVTAGHCLAQLRQYLRSSDCVVGGFQLIDIFGLSRSSGNMPVPFALSDDDLMFIDDDGLDFGIIPLKNFYVRALAANGMVAVEEENWVHQHSIEFDGYLMLGIPSHSVSERVAADDTVSLASTLVRVEALSEPAVDDVATAYQRFRGRVGPDAGDIGGMSGGPIIGIRQRGSEIRYWVVALQSSWLPKTRVIYGCPVPVFASLLARWSRSESEGRD